MTLPEAAGVNTEAEGKAYLPCCPKRSVKAQMTTFPERQHRFLLYQKKKKDFYKS